VLLQCVLVEIPNPTGKNVSTIVKLQNITNDAVTYKIKTTTPKRYHVVPTSGIISPQQTIDVKGNQPTDQTVTEPLMQRGCN
jgi:hypothetical protein